MRATAASLHVARTYSGQEQARRRNEKWIDGSMYEMLRPLLAAEASLSS